MFNVHVYARTTMRKFDIDIVIRRVPLKVLDTHSSYYWCIVTPSNLCRTCVRPVSIERHLGKELTAFAGHARCCHIVKGRKFSLSNIFFLFMKNFLLKFHPRQYVLHPYTCTTKICPD